MTEPYEAVELSTLRHRVRALSDAGCRFATISCCSNSDGSFDLIYSFDKDLKLTNLLLVVQKDTLIPSVSGVYLAAAFVENEIGELFGLRFDGLAIDYGGRFVLSEGSPSEPFGRGIVVVRKEDEKNV